MISCPKIYFKGQNWYINAKMFLKYFGHPNINTTQLWYFCGRKLSKSSSFPFPFSSISLWLKKCNWLTFDIFQQPDASGSSSWGSRKKVQQLKAPINHGLLKLRFQISYKSARWGNSAQDRLYDHTPHQILLRYSTWKQQGKLRFFLQLCNIKIILYCPAVLFFHKSVMLHSDGGKNMWKRMVF